MGQRIGGSTAETSAALRRALPLAGELYAHDGVALPGNRVHFGYRDNIAQPDVDGAPLRKHELEYAPDPLNSVKTGNSARLSE
jgi:deferrochelatase/peroxidase EfeB